LFSMEGIDGRYGLRTRYRLVWMLKDETAFDTIHSLNGTKNRAPKRGSLMREVSSFLTILIFLSLQTVGAEPERLDNLKRPSAMPEFIVDGNPTEQKTIHIEVEGIPMLDIGWRYTGTHPSSETFKFPSNVLMNGRVVGFWEVEFTNLTSSPIRFIEGKSSEGVWISKSDSNWRIANPRFVSRHDLGASVSQFDVMPGVVNLRKDFFIYGPQNGGRPKSENTYVYYVSDLDKWFSVKIVRQTPEK